MILDKTLLVSSQQALTADAASSDVVDLGNARLIGPGEPLWWVIAVRVGLAGAGAAFKAEIETDDNSGFSSALKLLASESFSTLAAGSRVVLPMTFNNERFMRLYYTVTGTITVDAFLTNQDPTSWQAFPNAI